MKKKPEQKQPGSRFIIGLGGGHREYDIINARYIVEGRFAEATLTNKDISSDVPSRKLGRHSISDVLSHSVQACQIVSAVCPATVFALPDFRQSPLPPQKYKPVSLMSLSPAVWNP